MKKGFTLIEIMVTICIIVALMAAMIGAYTKMTQSAERARAQELVSNMATALAAYFQDFGAWPKSVIAASEGDGLMDEKVALALHKAGYLTLTADKMGGQCRWATKLLAMDKFGIVSPWATTVMKRLGSSATKSSVVTGKSTILDHTVHFAVDLDGDGIIESANVGGQSIDVRATAIAWCAGHDGKLETYSRGLRKDDVYSWTKGQTQGVK